MTERLPLRRAACLALLLGALAAPALRAQEAPPGRTCATPTPSEAVLQQHYEAVQAWVQQHPAPQGGETVTIPIAFHVVHNGTTGNIPDQWITDQVEVLNDAFADMGYRFVVAMLDRTENATWFSTCYGSGENPMKQALAIDPAHFLNIYTCLPSGGILGYAYLPDGDESSIHHGVVLHYNTLPGGGLFPYNQGDTGTHEVGHYVGLLHTFDGGCSGGDTPPGCETGGDRVCDTPAEASAAFGCPAGRDTCPTGGPDPIQNFMDYTDDACMNHFTPGQTERSLALMSQFRPTIMSSPDAFAAPGALAFVNVRLGESETKRVHVVNLTDDPLLVAAIETDNDAFAADATSLTVPPGEGAPLDVTFTPAEAGTETGTLSLATTDPDVGTLTVALTGTAVPVAPVLLLDRDGILAAAPAGGSTAEPLTIVNKGNAPLEFAFASVPPWITAIAPSEGTVEPLEAVEVELALSAGGLGEGAYQDLLGLLTNDPEQGERALHVVFAVGDAVPPPALLSPRYEADDVPTAVALRWTAVGAASGYAVEVSEEEDFGEVAYSFEVADPRVEFTAAAGSRLYWRVRSLAGGGEESEWSLPFVFTVANLVANEPPPAEPTRSLLGVPFPNPARGTVTVPFTLDAARAVTLRVYDVTGRLVATLAEGQPFAAGAHALRFDADALPAGVYAVRLEAGREAEARRVVLLR